MEAVTIDGLTEAEQRSLDRLVEQLRAAMDWVEKRAQVVINAYGGRWECRDGAIRVYGSPRSHDGTVVVPLAGPPVPGGICYMILGHVAEHSPERELRRVTADRTMLNHLLASMTGDYAPWNADIIATMAGGYGITTEET
jgi:hypothetical protein